MVNFLYDRILNHRDQLVTFKYNNSMCPQASDDDVRQLIEELENATTLKKRGKATKRVLDVLNSEKKLVSWKFNEWDYAKDKIKLPSNARGLFTLEDEPAIAVRGYDKFFNVNEVAITRWDWLEANTDGPYYVTAKENGCIILISGLQDGTIVVCSKHSTGARDDATKNHAIAGQRFLEKQLQELGLSTQDLAHKLHSLNLTAVAEFCDDDFEEHIIEYKGKDAGLYLHGLNLNKPLFETCPIEEVNKFADEWGFRQVEYFAVSTIKDLEQELSMYSKCGSYHNKEIEGFVVRCKRVLGETKHDYFFKFKFEEPYLMYRQWREVTKEYLHHGKRSEIKFSKHRFITNKYLDFVIPLLDNNTKLAEDYKEGFGIIELRNKFLQSYGKSGPEILNQELLEELEVINSLDTLKIDETTRFVIVPVATIGCGKTTTSQTLVNIYKESWELVSNDDIPNGKNAKTVFIKRGLEALKEGKKLVILDRNNHQYRERQQIFDDFSHLRDDYIPHDINVQFICLNFVSDETDNSELWNTTVKRVLERGDNHQSIKAASESSKVKGIMAGFVKRFQPVVPDKIPDSKFDLIIDLDLSGENSSLENSKKILTSLHELYPVLVDTIPADAIIEKNFDLALRYKPIYTKVMGKSPSQNGTHKKKQGNEKTEQKRNNGKKKEKTPVYFSIDIPNQNLVISNIENLLVLKDTSLTYDHSAWNYLKESGRFQEEFHVTLAHCNQKKRGTEREKKVWNSFLETVVQQKKNVRADIVLKKLIWNKKIMTVVVEISRLYDAQTTEHFDLTSANKYPHITIGILSSDTKPVYSNTLAEEVTFFEGEGIFENDLNVLIWDDDKILQNLPVKVIY